MAEQHPSGYDGPAGRRFARLRKQGWRRALVLILAATVLFMAGGLIIGPSSDRQEELVSQGITVEGKVTQFSRRPRGPDSVSYRYTYEGVQHQSTIVATESYRDGQTVTVYLDPSEPTRSTLPDEQPQSMLGFLLTLGTMSLSFGLLGWGVQDLWRTWRTRKRASFRARQKSANTPLSGQSVATRLAMWGTPEASQVAQGPTAGRSGPLGAAGCAEGPSAHGLGSEPCGDSRTVHRPLLMILAGRSGMSYYILFALLLALLSALDHGELPPQWFMLILGWLAFDCVGGVRIQSGSIRFRRYVRFARIPVSSVASVNVYRSVGVRGTCAVVTLKLHDKSKVRIGPMASLSMTQARNAVRDVASMIGAAPPARNWDGS